ncbi:MAG: hypothetical protein K2O49_06825, partial [Muribaculaceae bacterium]|nr:hypothetical protein [Muribaculaceae bacterium]
GRDAVKKVIKDKPELMAELEEKIMATLNAKREEARARGGNPYAVSASSNSDGKDDDAPRDDEFGAEQDNEDLFGDDFEVDIEEN